MLAETAVLVHRNLRNILRTKELFFVRLFICVVTGLVLGSVYWDIPVSSHCFLQLTLAIYLNIKV
jgi:ABC-2 type transporter